MKNNPLLVHSEVGLAKKSSYDLPKSENFVYGLKCEKDEFSARRLIKEWKSHEPSILEEDSNLNFRKVNKISVSKNIFTVKNQQKMLNELTPRERKNFTCSPKKKFIQKNSNFQFKSQRRSSTPIDKILSNFYSHQPSNSKLERKTRLRRETRASQGHAKVAKNKIEPEKKTEFKLTKFKNVKSHFQQEK